MDIFINLWNNWTSYEKIYIGIILLTILVVFPLSIKIFTKRNNLALISLVSTLISGILTVLVMWFVHSIFKVTITSAYLISPLIITFINILNIGTLVGAYGRLHSTKQFDIIMLKKEFLRDTFQLSIFILLLFTVMSVFAPSAIFAMLILSGGISLVNIWINYTLFYKIGF